MINQKTCPLCKKQNGCQVNTSSNCWCNDIKIPNALLKLVPKEYSGKTCICKKCVLSFIEDEENFIKDYYLKFNF